MKIKNIKNEYSLYFRLLKYTNKNLILFIICTIISGIAVFLIFSSIGILLSNIVGAINGENTQDYSLSLIYILVIFIFAILSSFSDIGFVYVEQKLQILLRNKMLKSYFKMDENISHKYSNTEVLNHVTEDVNQSTFLISYYMSGFIFQPILSGLFSVILLYIVDWRIAILCLICTLGNFIFSRLTIKWVRKIRSNIVNGKSQTSNFMQECIEGAIEMRTFKLYKTFNNSLYNKLENISYNTKKFAFIEGLRRQISNISNDCLTIIILLSLGALLAYYKIIDFSNIMLSIPLSDQIGQMIMAFANFTAIVKQKSPHLERVFEIIDLPQELDNKINSNLQNNIKDTSQIIFDNVSFSYEEKEVLKQVSFNIKKGEKIAFVGESGSGKSTIIKILLGLYNNNYGNINVFGLEKENCSIEKWRSNFSYLPQDISLFNLTVAENISLGNGNLEDIRTVGKMANIDEFISNKPKGYNLKLQDGNVEFSGGQLQRIALARCLFKKSPIILMDEPTSALDKESEQIIKETIEQLPQDITIIIVTHRLNLTKNFDRLYVLEKGSIIESGNHNELLEKNGKYAYLWNIQDN